MLAVLACPAAATEFVDVARDNVVLSRPRPELDAIGVPIGAFRAYPSLTAGVAYDDNVFARATGQADAFFEVAPRIALQSGWSQNFLKVTADANLERFARITSENNDRYSIDALGRLDVDHATVVELETLFARRVETRGSSGDAINGSRPIVFYDAGGHLAVTATRGALTLTGRVEFDTLRYQPAQVGGQFFAQAYRDVQSTVTRVEVSTPVGPQAGAILSLRYNDQAYPNRDQGTVPLDSRGFAALAGVKFGLTSITSGQITAGYQRQTFRAPTFPTIAGPTYDARIVWNPTTLVSVTTAARRSIEQSPMTNVAGILADEASVVADYELLRNLLVNVRADYVVEAYRGTDRLDRRVSTGIEARYLLNRGLSLGARYDYRDQASRGAGARPYRGNAVLLQLTVQR